MMYNRAQDTDEKTLTQSTPKLADNNNCQAEVLLGSYNIYIGMLLEVTYDIQAIIYLPGCVRQYED